MTQIDKGNYPYDINYEEFNRLEFTNSLASMLRSYTRAINIQEKHTGALFRERTKATCLGSVEGEKLKCGERCIKGKEQMPDFNDDYLQTCFNYIHQNPVKVNLAKQSIDREFSSAREIWGIGNAKLVNKRMVKELGLQFDLVSG
jgi:putative transposase